MATDLTREAKRFERVRPTVQRYFDQRPSAPIPVSFHFNDEPELAFPVVIDVVDPRSIAGHNWGRHWRTVQMYNELIVQQDQNKS